MAPSVLLYQAVVVAVKQLGVNTFTPAQDVPGLPAVRIQLVNSNSTNTYMNAREYRYPFQLDVVTEQDKLVEGLTLAYKIMDVLRKINIAGYYVSADDPSMNSLVDGSTNETLNRQMIQVTYSIIEDTAF